MSESLEGNASLMFTWKVMMDMKRRRKSSKGTTQNGSQYRPQVNIVTERGFLVFVESMA
jgi:hypothetical protein